MRDANMYKTFGFPRGRTQPCTTVDSGRMRLKVLFLACACTNSSKQSIKRYNRNNLRSQLTTKQLYASPKHSKYIARLKISSFFSILLICIITCCFKRMFSLFDWRNWLVLKIRFTAYGTGTQFLFTARVTCKWHSGEWQFTKRVGHLISNASGSHKVVSLSAVGVNCFDYTVLLIAS